MWLAGQGDGGPRQEAADVPGAGSRRVSESCESQRQGALQGQGFQDASGVRAARPAPPPALMMMLLQQIDYGLAWHTLAHGGQAASSPLQALTAHRTVTARLQGPKGPGTHGLSAIDFPSSTPRHSRGQPVPPRPAHTVPHPGHTPPSLNSTSSISSTPLFLSPYLPLYITTSHP